MEERWKNIAGCEDAYEVSDFGRVRSVDRVATHFNSRWKVWVIYRMKGKLLTPWLQDKHLMVALGSARKAHVHSLVLETFVGPCPSGMECRHLNGHPEINRLHNLKWDTRVNNSLDRKKHQTTRSCSSKLSIEAVREIKLRSKGSLKVLAEEFGVSTTTICRIRLGTAHSDV